MSWSDTQQSGKLLSCNLQELEKMEEVRKKSKADADTEKNKV